MSRRWWVCWLPGAVKAGRDIQPRANSTSGWGRWELSTPHSPESPHSWRKHGKQGRLVILSSAGGVHPDQEEEEEEEEGGECVETAGVVGVDIPGLASSSAGGRSPGLHQDQAEMPVRVEFLAE